MFVDNFTYLAFRIKVCATHEEEDKKLLKEVERMSGEVEPISAPYIMDGWFHARVSSVAPSRGRGLKRVENDKQDK